MNNAAQQTKNIHNQEQTVSREPTELEIMTSVYWDVSFTYNQSTKAKVLRLRQKPMTVSDAISSLRAVLQWQGKLAKQTMLFGRASLLQNAIIEGAK